MEAQTLAALLTTTDSPLPVRGRGAGVGAQLQLRQPRMPVRCLLVGMRDTE